jgi:hypothetical protein
VSDQQVIAQEQRTKKKRRVWRGVKWPYVKRGVCTRHGKKVGPLGVCITCHREQLAAAEAGSDAWQRDEREE